MAAAAVSVDATASSSVPTPVKRVPVLPKYQRTMETTFHIEFPVLKRDVRLRVEVQTSKDRDDFQMPNVADVSRYFQGIETKETTHEEKETTDEEKETTEVKVVRTLTFLLPKEVAGVFGYCHECDEMTDDDDPETLVDCFASFPVNGLVQLLRFVDIVRSNPGYEWMTLGYPIGQLSSKDTFCLMRYGFPQWAVDLFESSFFTTTDIFDMIVTAEFLRSPTIRSILLLRVASYINTIPDDVYIACFVPDPKTGKAPTIEKSYEETKAVLDAHPWLADKKDPSFIKDETITEETRKRHFESRFGGPNEDLPLIKGLQRIPLTAYKQIFKFV